MDYQIIFFILSSAVIVVISIIDMREMIIPDLIIFPSILLLLIMKLIITSESLLHMLVLLSAGFLPFFLIHFGTSGKMGLGDAKFSAFLALLLDFEGWLLMVSISSAVALLFALSGLALKKIDRFRPIPFGPFLGFGAFLSFFLLYGNHI